MTPKMLCESAEALTLLPFLEEVFSYEFEQTPDYAKLRNVLLQCLKADGKEYDHIYDWNEKYELSRPRDRPRANLDHKKVDPDVDELDVQEQAHALDKMRSYQFIANENHAAMKKVHQANQEDAHMATSFDRELASLGNPHGRKDHSPQGGPNLNQISSPTTFRHN